ncbi:DNA replication and repair protein RecF [termite gut metagenome]|uniref:DNA replication and repair protein RecF n=1 Tax=termite gut metagenome TaxID=433724 RepID=A0A5J4RZ15_9ZZZZ
MRLEKVNIHNYRCFSNYEISFTQGVNILIGKNGSGKTIIINAIRHGLSFVFARNTPSNNDQSLATSADGLTVESPSTMDAFYDKAIQDYRYPIAIQCIARIKGILLPQWEIYKESAGGRVFSTKYKEASQEFENQNHLPVLSLYSDSYPHLKSSLSKYAERILSSGYMIPKNFGYYQWSAESACTEVWEQRFINLWQEIGNKRLSLKNYIGYIENKESTDDFLKSLGLEKDMSLNPTAKYNDFIKKFPQKATETRLQWELINLEREREIITNFLIKFSKPLSPISSDLDQFIIKGLEVSTRLQNNYLNVRFEDGRSILFQNLPTGYKRLFSIVLDIAYRAYILQLREWGIFTFLEKAENVTGIVVIDEIDLHLHPSLEQEVIQRFQNTFPNIQFIVSTHSNLVIANLKENEGRNSIISLENVVEKYTNKKIPNIFGISYEASLLDFMGISPRNSDVKYLAEAYIRLEKREEKEQAQAMRTELIKGTSKN